ncbi:MAG: hypothetical protein D6816_11545 [Bacteroidetes bacterium]|nr:MAG: hypothetical protein D6816_11545 [Bacteroidota bacterium]
MAQVRNKREGLFWFLAIACFAIGLIGIYDRLVHGHVNANYGSYIPWGLWVAAYIYMIGLSAGAFVMSSLVYVFKVKAFKKIGKLSLLVALATLVGALVTIWMDLGHMGRAWRLMFKTNFMSVMGWMVWLYSAYFILLIIELWLAMRSDLVRCSQESGLRGKICNFLLFGNKDDSPERQAKSARLLTILGTIGIPLAIAFHGSVGAIFGVVGARPYWHSGLTPIIFLIGAFLSGGALLTFIAANWAPNKGTEEHRSMIVLLGKILLAMLAFDVLLEYAEITVGLWQSVPEEAASLKLILFGEYWWVFWFVHVGLGVVVPALLLIFKGRSVRAVAIAGALIAVTFLAVRLNIVLPGLSVPEIEGLLHAYSSRGLTFDYFPSVSEWLVFIWSISLAGLIFLLGKTYLPILDDKGNESLS